MRAAIIPSQGAAPVFGEHPEPPEALSGYIAPEVDMAGLGGWDVLSQYRTGIEYPCVLMGEGVGRSEDGERYYFGSRSLPPFGAFAERTLVPLSEAWKVPDGVDDAAAINMAIAGTGAWVPLEQAQIAKGEAVLILGATGLVGQLGLHFARILGAGRVVGAARNAGALSELKARGLADEVVTLGQGDDVAALREASGDGFDVVLDPVGGEPLIAALKTTKFGARIKTVGVGAGITVTLNLADLLFRHLTMVGTGQRPPEDRQAIWHKLLKLAGDHAISLPQVDFQLEGVADAWALQLKGPHAKIITHIRR